jgi:glycosyltransferase involved in cell wall biosynthesis
MRIAQIAPLAESVPPKFYGGTERVVAWPSGDSRTRGRLHPVWPNALRLGQQRSDPMAATALLLEAISKQAKDFDVIHAHIDWLHLPLLGRLGVPFLTTMHGRLDLPGLPHVIREFPEANFVSISENQRLPLLDANWCGTVQHGLPINLFRPSYGKGSYLAFLGRLTAEKGPEKAIRIARAAHMPLRIAAKIPRAEKAYFKKHLEPQIDGEDVRFIGEVNDATKRGFLPQAAALLFPIDWPEPFGLVMIEAMACGTPVIAYRSGSVPEVIEEGVTGFIVDSEEEAVDAVNKLARLDRRKVRGRFDERFSAHRMARAYESHYRRLIDGSIERLAPTLSALGVRRGTGVPFRRRCVENDREKSVHDETQDGDDRRFHVRRRCAAWRGVGGLLRLHDRDARRLVARARLRRGDWRRSCRHGWRRRGHGSRRSCRHVYGGAAGGLIDRMNGRKVCLRSRKPSSTVARLVARPVAVMAWDSNSSSMSILVRITASRSLCIDLINTYTLESRCKTASAMGERLMIGRRINGGPGRSRRAHRRRSWSASPRQSAIALRAASVAWRRYRCRGARHHARVDENVTGKFKERWAASR